MRKFFKALWNVVTFPFVLIYKIIALPFVLIKRFHRFLNTEPDEHPLADVLEEVITDHSVRAYFWREVEALRMHLLRMVLGLALGVGISFYFTEQIIQFLAQPVGGLQELKAIEVTESIGVFMRVALLSGLLIMLPYIAFEIWLFAAPGLRSRERKFGLVAIPIASLLFMTGVVFTYYILLPPALQFLLNFMGIQAELRPNSYYTFVTGLMFWIGLFFEFPLVVYILTAIGVVKPQFMAQQWRLAVVIISIIAAAITPTVDPVNMALVMIPMVLLYFISIGLSYIAYAGRKRQNAPTEN